MFDDPSFITGKAPPGGKSDKKTEKKHGGFHSR